MSNGQIITGVGGHCTNLYALKLQNEWMLQMPQCPFLWRVERKDVKTINYGEIHGAFNEEDITQCIMF